MPLFILTVMSVSSNGLTVLKVSKILSNRNYCSNYSVICILAMVIIAFSKMVAMLMIVITSMSVLS